MPSRLIPFPSFPIDGQRRYQLSPRAKRSFHTILDAAAIIDPADSRTSRVAFESAAGDGGHQLTLSFEHPLIGGKLEEKLTLVTDGDGLRATQFVRSAWNNDQQRVRHEEVDFGDGILPLPPETYPEVAVPFLIPWFPIDGKQRDVYAWINDRFVARIMFKRVGTTKLTLGSRTLPAVELVMFPDINDWVHLGRVISRMVQPFLPKYRLWCAPEPPFEILRFEGPYGPPGAPEVVLELAE